MEDLELSKVFCLSFMCLLLIKSVETDVSERASEDSGVAATMSSATRGDGGGDRNDTSGGPSRPDHPSGQDYLAHCPSNLVCSLLSAECIDCDFGNNSCIYGKMTNVTCRPKPNVVCKSSLGVQGETNFTRTFKCQYCYQTPQSDQECTSSTECRVVSAPRAQYQANCTVKSHVLCLGRRRFYKLLDCNWTSGYRWSTALILSICLGGFGVDRFYLGLWREGIGKLFSFGGLGVWTIVDVILIATGYVTPSDGSLYIF